MHLLCLARLHGHTPFLFDLRVFGCKSRGPRRNKYGEQKHVLTCAASGADPGAYARTIMANNCFFDSRTFGCKSRGPCTKITANKLCFDLRVFRCKSWSRCTKTKAKHLFFDLGGLSANPGAHARTTAAINLYFDLRDVGCKSRGNYSQTCYV